VPVRAEDLAAAEDNLGVALPEDYRAMLMASDGLVELMPAAYVQLWPLADVVRINGNDCYGLAQALPGLVLIGSDGGGELLGSDIRKSPARVVLVNAVSASWTEASEQGDSLSTLMARLRAGGEYRFD
jgi:hypothetical protein